MTNVVTVQWIGTTSCPRYVDFWVPSGTMIHRGDDFLRPSPRLIIIFCLFYYTIYSGICFEFTMFLIYSDWLYIYILAGRVGDIRDPGRRRSGHPRIIRTWLEARVHAPNHRSKTSQNIFYDWWFQKQNIIIYYHDICYEFFIFYIHSISTQIAADWVNFIFVLFV